MGWVGHNNLLFHFTLRQQNERFSQPSGILPLIMDIQANSGPVGTIDIEIFLYSCARTFLYNMVKYPLYLYLAQVCQQFNQYQSKRCNSCVTIDFKKI